MGKRISQLKLCLEAVYVYFNDIEVYFEVSSMSLQRFLKQIKTQKNTPLILMISQAINLGEVCFLNRKIL